MSEPIAVQNTDRELWRDPDSDEHEGYQDVVFVTNDNMLGIKVGGNVQMRPARAWFRLARKALGQPDPSLPPLELDGDGDHRMRLEALDRALAWAPPDTHHSVVVATAAEFERFLRGERG